MGLLTKKSSKIENSISRTSNLILNLFFIIYLVLCISPLILVFMVSISDEMAIARNGYSFFPEKFSFLSYEYILNDAAQIIRSYGNSIFVTVVGTFFHVLVTALYAYPICRKDFKYRNFFSFSLFFTMLFNGGLVPWYMVYSNVLNLKNNIFVLIIPMLLSPMHVLIMKTFFSSSIHDSIIEAAKIDGAGEFRIFFSIVLRLSTPALATIALFSTISYWNDWFHALMFITDSKLVPLQFLLYRVVMSLEAILEMSSNIATHTISDLPGESARMALCMVTMGPIVIAYPFFQKYFIKGLTIGSVKG